MLNISGVQKHTRLAQVFWKDRGGDVAAMFGLMAIALFLMIGGAVDYGRWLHARNTTIAAMDAAVLAGGRSLQVDGDAAAAVEAANTFYLENTKNRLPVQNDTIQFVVADDGLSVTGNGNAYVETPFLSLAHIERLPLFEEGTAEYSKAEIAVGGNAGINLEISMMLDVTGSMSGSRISDLKDAAKDLIDIVVWEDQSEYSSRVALVPFSEGIRLPSSARSTARGSAPSTYDYRYWYYGRQYTRRYYRTDCMAERMGLQAFTDAAPGSGAYVATVYTTSSSRYCRPDSSAVIRPLSNDKTALKTAIDNLATGGGTGGHLGTAWSWYTLSPNWNNLWADSVNHAVPYGTPETQKIAILMSDGEYNTQYGALDLVNNGTVARNTSSNSADNGSSTTQARAMCTAMKLAGITVYTVGFGLSSGSTAATTLAQCATDSSKAFSASDGEQLRQSFRAIALEISKLYLSS